jgi:hypothetical protein
MVPAVFHVLLLLLLLLFGGLIVDLSMLTCPMAPCALLLAPSLTAATHRALATTLQAHVAIRHRWQHTCQHLHTSTSLGFPWCTQLSRIPRK